MSAAVPSVSVGLPVYNGERFIARAVESALAQTFTDFELIICDNGSTDGTAQVCRAFAERDPRVRYYRNPQNLGAARNFNRTFELSRGRYFRWAAHDDVCRPQFLQRCVEVLDTRSDVSLCYARAVDVNDRGEIVHEHLASTLATQAQTPDRVADLLQNPSPCIEAFGLMRREQLARTGLIGAYTASDRTLLLEMAIQGRFHQVGDVLFLHGQHADRSVFRYRCARAMMAWFDTSQTGRFSLPTWRLLAEYRAAIGRSPLDGAARLRCQRHLARWAAANARSLTREIASGARYLVLRGASSVGAWADGLRRIERTPLSSAPARTGRSGS